MSKIAFSFLFLIAFFSAAAKDTLDITKDISVYLNASLQNITGDGQQGNTKALQEIVNYNHNILHDQPLLLFVPPGTRLKLDTTLFLSNNITIVFSRQSLVFSTRLIAPNSNVIETIGCSGVHIINMQYTNYQSQFINAVVQFKASPYQCINNTITGCFFHNIWASAGIMLAFIGDSDSSYWLDNTLLQNDTIINNFNPQKPHMDNYGTNSEYHTNVDCAGIDIVNANKKLDITGCVITNTGGDGIKGFGLTKAFSHSPTSGNIHIWNNTISNNNMNIEINGNYPPNFLFIEKNNLSYPAGIGYSCISAEGKPLIVKDNVCKSANSGMFELSFYGGECSGNQCYQYMWKDSSMGFNHRPFTDGSSRVPAVYVYGYMGTIHDNLFFADTAGKSSTSPNEMMGVGLLGKAANGDSMYDRNYFITYQSFQNGGGHRIYRNTFIGQTNRLLDNSMSPNDDIAFTDNTIVSSNLSGTDAIWWIKGNHYTFLNNTIDVSKSAKPMQGVGIIYKVQGTGEVVEGNKITGGEAWIANTPNYHFKSQ